MAAAGDYIKTLTRRIVALHEASALVTTIDGVEKTFAQAVQPKERISRSRDLGHAHTAWPQWQAGTRGKDDRLEWDLMLVRVERSPVAVTVTFGANSRTSPPTCPQTLHKVLVFESIITAPNGRSDSVTSLYALSEHILTKAGSGLSPADYTNIPWVAGVGLMTARFEDVPLSPDAASPSARIGSGPRHRGRVEIPVAVSLVTTTDILGA